MTTAPTPGLAELYAATSFRFPFRRYQGLALDAWERGLATGQQRSYLVLPPGAGKTALGLEVARRLGRHALVLCPNTAVQAQWLRQWQDFQPGTVAADCDPELAAPITVLTYQALCNLNGDGDGLSERALALWQAALAAQDSIPLAAATASLAGLAAANPRAYAEQLASYRRRARQLVARGGERAELLALLHPNGRALVERLAANGPWTLVLDECHHLLAIWGYLVEAVLAELGPETFVCGLTATPPADMESGEAELYRRLFGQADFQVATPAVVKEGDLAPYQELAFLTQPLAAESRFVAAQHERFQDLTGKLLAGELGSTPFLDWVWGRAGERATVQGACLSWSQFEREHPSLALAVLRLYFSLEHRLPEGARLTERHRLAPTADDWVALIDDYCRHCLLPSADPADHVAWQQLRRALLSLGYVLTAQGARSYVSPIDRVLALSASKGLAAVEILAAERDALGDHLRALVLCDYEKAGSDVLAKLRGVLDPQAGSAALLLHTLLMSRLTAELKPILVTGRTVACSRDAAASLTAWLGEQAPELRDTVSLDALFAPGPDGRAADWEDVVVVRPAHPSWQPRCYVPLLTRYFEEGHCRCLVGTRGLLGEGWDAKSVNVLIDLTAAGTSTTVHQMRGRSIRLDPNLPRKVADNWDVVCLAPEHPKGAADYARFVRKHRVYYAPTPEGEIESGVSHVHPDFSPYGPPLAARFAGLNECMLARAGARDIAYERWGVGQPYENAETHTVRVRAERSLGLPERGWRRHSEAEGPARRIAIGLVLGLLSAVGLAVTFELPAGFVIVVAVGLIAAACAGVGLSFLRAVRTLQPSDALEDLAAALHESLRETGGIASPPGATSVQTALQHDGHYRCYLAGGTAEESQLFAESLDELLSPLAAPRYLIPRYVAEAPRSIPGALWAALRQRLPSRPGAKVVYHAVPPYLAANKEKAEAFARAWHRHVGPGRPLFCQTPRAQAILELQRGANPFAITTQMRVLWR